MEALQVDRASDVLTHCSCLFCAVAWQPLSFRKEDFTEYDDMNKVILSVGNARDAEGLLNIVRKNSGDGEPESLDFHHTNCCIWLSKYVCTRPLTTGSQHDLSLHPRSG